MIKYRVVQEPTPDEMYHQEPGYFYIKFRKEIIVNCYNNLNLAECIANFLNEKE